MCHSLPMAHTYDQGSELPADIAQRAAEVVALRAQIKATEAVCQRIAVDTVVENALTSREAGTLFGISHMTIQRWVNARYPTYYSDVLLVIPDYMGEDAPS